jgi:hypothetical protein
MGLKVKPSTLIGATPVVLAAALMFVIFFYARRDQPSVEEVSGSYTSACCGTIVITPTSVRYGNLESQLKYYHMKFGLTAYAKQKFGPFYLVSGKNIYPPVFYFKSDGSLVLVDFGGAPVEFRSSGR